MSKAYSNKALPPGTVLREWRLDEVLGVGGFGIVYKARGIYFNELVAIKEYFPSSISERDEEATVVPIDSDAEEVHALGLKKFVEEAKLLWNLSTPSRHPNIVSVRSLFEIHGTAYMVMDFEDGTSLSRLLKNGQRFNERSLWDIIAPISEGLDRAHRVGVLHRDIKPPNILITPEGRSVLIDFGSARFDTAEATSTQVTFHTPPYAAIEQYVKTYSQGPWTDIYALGVVLFECVTGAKPPEVLERLHGGQIEPLAAGKWPGYSKAFLAAIDAAMTIKPDGRPQSITEWLALFPQGSSARVGDGEDEERTRFTINEVAVQEIVPVAPPVDIAEVPIETNVPADPGKARFSRAGDDASLAQKMSAVAAPPAMAAARSEEDDAAPKVAKSPVAASSSAPLAKPAHNKGVLVAGVAAAVLAVGAAGWTLLPQTTPASSSAVDEQVIDTSVPASSYAGPDTGTLAPGIKTLADAARDADAPAAAIDALDAAGDKLADDQRQVEALLGNPQRAAEAMALQTSMNDLALATSKAFATALSEDVSTRRQRLSGTTERAMLASLDARSTSLKTAAQAVATAPDGSAAFAATRGMLGQYRTLRSALSATPAVKLASEAESPRPASPKLGATTKQALAATAPVAAKTAAPVAQPTVSAGDETASPAKLGEMNGIIDEARGMARQVMRADRGENSRLARGYDDYLKTLKRSARSAKTNAQADGIITGAKRTRAYLVFLVKQTQAQ